MKESLAKGVNLLFIFITGVCIGILAGLSVSPVIEKLLSSVLTLVITLLSVWYGLKSDKSNATERRLLQYKISFIPVGLLVIGLTLGSLGGIYLRTHNILGTSPINNEVQDKKGVKDKSNDSAEKARLGVLFGTPIEGEPCNLANRYSGTTLVKRLEQLNDSTINRVIDSLGRNHPDEIKKQIDHRCRVN